MVILTIVHFFFFFKTSTPCTFSIPVSDCRSKNSKNGHIYQCTSVHYCQFFLEFLLKQCKGHAILSNNQWIKLIYKKCLWRIFPIPEVLLPWKLNFPAKTKSRGGGGNDRGIFRNFGPPTSSKPAKDPNTKSSTVTIPIEFISADSLDSLDWGQMKYASRFNRIFTI